MTSPVRGVLLLPGAGARCAGYFPGVAEALAAEPGWRVIEQDLTVPLAAAAGHLHQVIARAGAGPVVVVGHSLGAAVALLLARDHPGDVAGLVLLDTTPINDAALCRRIEWAFRSVGAVSRIPLVGSLFRARFGTDADPVGLGRAVTGLASAAAGFESAVLPRRPAAVVTADRDPGSATRRAHRRLADALGAALVCWPGSTHSVHLTHPHDTLATVREVLSRA